MKVLKSIIAICVIAFAIPSFGQSSNIKTIKFKVDGVCGMCKERIETAADIKGVKYVNWSVETHVCEVTYRTDKVTQEDIFKAITAVGHDTEKLKASDDAYSNIHGCCRYRSKETQDAHKKEHSDHNHE